MYMFYVLYVLYNNIQFIYILYINIIYKILEVGVCYGPDAPTSSAGMCVCVCVCVSNFFIIIF